MDRNKVYDGIKDIKKRQAKQVPPDNVAASRRVLQFSTIGNQQHSEDDKNDASRNKPGHPKGATAMASEVARCMLRHSSSY
jgi:hypothetical protein